MFPWLELSIIIGFSFPHGSTKGAPMIVSLTIKRGILVVLLANIKYCCYQKDSRLTQHAVKGFPLPCSYVIKKPGAVEELSDINRKYTSWLDDDRTIGGYPFVPAILPVKYGLAPDNIDEFVLGPS